MGCCRGDTVETREAWLAGSLEGQRQAVQRGSPPRLRHVHRHRRVLRPHAHRASERMEGEAGDGADARAHEPLVELDGVQQVALQVEDADALVH